MRQENLNLNQRSNYARLADHISPQPNNKPPVFQHPSPHHQNITYNINRQLLQNTQNHNIRQTAMKKYASKLKCLCITVILQNIFYITMPILLNLTILLILMILEVIGFSVFLSMISKGMVSRGKVKEACIILVCACIVYVFYFIIMFFPTIQALNGLNIDKVVFGLLYSVFVGIFLLPRFIALCVAGKTVSRSVSARIN